MNICYGNLCVLLFFLAENLRDIIKYLTTNIITFLVLNLATKVPFDVTNTSHRRNNAF